MPKLSAMSSALRAEAYLPHTLPRYVEQLRAEGQRRRRSAGSRQQRAAAGARRAHCDQPLRPAGAQAVDAHLAEDALPGERRVRLVQLGVTTAEQEPRFRELVQHEEDRL